MIVKGQSSLASINTIWICYFQVQEILDHKFENNTKYFLIRWKGYDSSVDSWESQYNISCSALLAKYYEKVKTTNKKLFLKKWNQIESNNFVQFFRFECSTQMLVFRQKVARKRRK